MSVFQRFVYVSLQDGGPYLCKILARKSLRHIQVVGLTLPARGVMIFVHRKVIFKLRFRPTSERGCFSSHFAGKRLGSLDIAIVRQVLSD